VEDGFGAYSDLVIQEDRNIGIFYEGGSGYGSLYYQTLSLKQISGGQDSLPPVTVSGKDGTKPQAPEIFIVDGNMLLPAGPVNSTIYIHDVRGEKIGQVQIRDHSQSVPVPDLQPGIYWLRLNGKFRCFVKSD
jgi:hypothetical protein